ncbi:MAG: DoxX family protein [Acidimicrobiia bacterium]
MSLVRTIARPMLAGMFVYGGLDAIKNPTSKVAPSEGVAQPIAEALPVDLPDDTAQLVRLNGAVQLAAGVMLAFGRLPRVSALALATSLAPTTVAGHRFWEADDRQTRNQQLTHFLKNVSMFGGLLLAAVDTGGRPSVSWWARRAGRKARRRADRAAERVHDSASRAVGRTADVLHDAIPLTH